MNLLRAPAAPFVPAEWQGERVCVLMVCFSELDRVDEVMAPIRALGEPVFDLLAEQPYTQLQSCLDATEPKGTTTTGGPTCSPGSVTTCSRPRELAAGCPMPRTQIGVLHVGGALNERDGGDGAVGNRDAVYVCGAIGMERASLAPASSGTGSAPRGASHPSPRAAAT